MAEESLITPELKELLGKELPPERFEVEKGHIRRFAQAVGDPIRYSEMRTTPGRPATAALSLHRLFFSISASIRWPINSWIKNRLPRGS